MAKGKGTSRTAAAPTAEATAPKAKQPTTEQLAAAIRYLAKEAKRVSEVRVLLGEAEGGEQY